MVLCLQFKKMASEMLMLLCCRVFSLGSAKLVSPSRSDGGGVGRYAWSLGHSDFHAGNLAGADW